MGGYGSAALDARHQERYQVKSLVSASASSRQGQRRGHHVGTRRRPGRHPADTRQRPGGEHAVARPGCVWSEWEIELELEQLQGGEGERPSKGEARRGLEEKRSPTGERGG